jgi:hypothetical protein
MIKRKLLAPLSMALMISGGLTSLQAADSAGISKSVTTLASNIIDRTRSRLGLRIGSDFNNDGVPDILWRHKNSGQYVYFFMNADGSRKGYKNGYKIATNWEIVSTADQNNDGVPDMLWRDKNSGQYNYFFMNADGSRKGYKSGYKIATDWEIIN